MLRLKDVSLLWNWLLLLTGSFSSLVLLLGSNQSSFAFLLKDLDVTGRVRITKSSSRIIVNPHRFNGGYDPSSPLTWTPQQAAEFAIFHEGTPQHAGMQLRTAIQHWRGDDLAEFLTRLYLGQERQVQSQSNDDYYNNNHQRSLLYEPRNVRTPRWWGLETREGLVALRSLLSEALSNDTLQPREVARFAESFLLKEYKWPADQWDAGTTQSTGVVFEQDSFYSRGHGVTLAQVLWSVRMQRYGDPAFSPDDIVDMVTLPEKEDKQSTSLQMKEFYQTLVGRIVLTDDDKNRMVQRLAIGGWGPASIPQFVATILDNNHHHISQGQYGEIDFFDYPSQQDENLIPESNNNDNQLNEWDETDQQYGDNVANYAGVDDQVVLAYSKNNNQKAEDSVRMEYDQLVQEYWKRVEIPQRSSFEEDSSEEYARRTSEAKQSASLQ